MGLLSELGQRYSKAAKPFVEGTAGLKWVGQDATNFMTGFRVTKPAAAIAVGGILAYGAAKTAYDVGSYKKQQIVANAQDVGQLAAMSYEQNGGGRRDLGASGDLVFGLHNKRRGS